MDQAKCWAKTGQKPLAKRNSTAKKLALWNTQIGISKISLQSQELLGSSFFFSFLFYTLTNRQIANPLRFGIAN